MNAEFRNFDAAAAAVMRFLKERHGFGLWMVARVMQDRWIVLAASDNDFGVKAGDALEWEEPSFSREIVEPGPRVVQRCDDILAQINAPFPTRLAINAYLGVPLQTSCGRFFGALCAVDNVAHPEIDDSALSLLEILGGLLTGYIRKEIENNDLERHKERFRFEAMTDVLTHLPNLRAWQETLDKEQQRSRRLGDTIFISAVHLNEFNEINTLNGEAERAEMLRKTALALRYAVRNSDFLARVGVEEFAVLGVQCDSIDPDEVSARVRLSLEKVGINASVGSAVGRPSDTYREVWKNAGAVLNAARKKYNPVPRLTSG